SAENVPGDIVIRSPGIAKVRFQSSHVCDGIVSWPCSRSEDRKAGAKARGLEDDGAAVNADWADSVSGEPNAAIAPGHRAGTLPDYGDWASVGVIVPEVMIHDPISCSTKVHHAGHAAAGYPVYT